MIDLHKPRMYVRGFIVMANESTPPLPVLVLVRDLLFSSKITTTARAAGIQLKLLRDPAKLATETGDRLIVDLNLEGALPAAVDWRNRAHRPVIGFVSHVDTEIVAQARHGGIDHILARGAFADAIERWLTEKG